MSALGRMRGAMTRQVILTAAEAVFAEHGFAGARIDAIAASSGYDKKLIFRYFGDKLGLYAEVLRRADRELNDLQGRLLTQFVESGAAASLGAAVGATFDYLVGHPRFLRILTWEMADGWRTAAQIFSERDRGDVDRLSPLLSQPQQRQWLRSAFTPVIQLSMVLQVCQTYLAFLPLYRLLLPGEDLSSAEALAHAREYIIGLLVHGMTAGAKEDGDRDDQGKKPEQAERENSPTRSTGQNEGQRSHRKQV